MQEFLKIVPGLTIIPLSFYLAWKKIGNKVSCATTIGANKINARRIQAVTLTNHKDKPLTIFGIQAVIENDITYTVEEFDPPIILKPLETTTITTKPYSSLYIGSEKWEPELFLPQRVDIYLITEHKIVECKMVGHPKLKKNVHFEAYTPASKMTKIFNDAVYNENAKYAITYSSKNDSKIRTAIVDVSGFITNDWNFRHSLVPHEKLQSVEGVKEFLSLSKADIALNIYGVDELT